MYLSDTNTFPGPNQAPVLLLRVQNCKWGLSAEEASALTGWMDSYKVTEGQTVELDMESVHCCLS